MSTGTTIEWADAVWNPVRGCSIVSKGCTNCYAMRQAHRFSGSGKPYEGLTKLTKGGPVWTGKVRLVPELLDAPLHWKKPRRIFVNSMSDLFHGDVPDEFIDKVFAVMALCTQHTFQVLTKRPERMLSYMKRLGSSAKLLDAGARSLGYTLEFQGVYFACWPLQNVWLGVSVEDQAAADERIPLLLQTAAAVRWVSAEPLLGPVSLRWLAAWDGKALKPGGPGTETNELDGLRELNWVVVGGESGPGARPSHPDWFRSLRDQCAAAGVSYFFKQYGAWAPIPWMNVGPSARYVAAGDAMVARDGRVDYVAQNLGITELESEPRTYVSPMRNVGKRAAGRLLDGRTHEEYPQ